ncbi:MAG: S9 family peptidase [SAR202 cluster bacterium]|jgi:dipeptidyl aminopeptidase/acylaminoacyl peptidase|nr:S9 family peptidase [Dehalococcoidia bacterium]MQF88658.1 S9 family peptidase [SAR202 cluster bacterium]|tara:strand:+ start:22475 stop:24409 length:1935 start_codon:yes stop_codon:yes gene_type:complete
MPTTAPYGSWQSPITTDLIVSGAIGLGQIALDDEDIYWAELRPSEGGRMLVVKHTPDGETTDITPAPFSARTRVHEYGGGAYLVHEGVVYFSNYADQRMYRQDQGGDPQPITPETDMRYADGCFDSARDRIICVRENHTSEGEPVNAIVAVDALGQGEQQVLSQGSDFCSNPRISPDGSTLAWLTWDHPNMPWDGTFLLVASFNDRGQLGEPQVVAGGRAESIFQPEWSPDGVLHFVSDSSGWWNLWRWEDGQARQLTSRNAEFGKPQWELGSRTYSFASEELIACSYNEGGVWKIAMLQIESGMLLAVYTPFTEMGRGDIQAGDGKIVFIGGAPTLPVSLVLFDLASSKWQELRKSSDLDIDPGYISAAQPVEFPTEDGKTAHAFYYPPKNLDFQGPAGEKPPLLVKSHGGPTGAASSALGLATQFWTSRGIGVLDVNYGGSTGYGREYRERLNGKWGIVDVDDCCNAALHLVSQGEADGDRLAIDGGSAGGYTTLAALTFKEVFKAGASLYGVSDLEALAKKTHKFESRYLDGLVGPYPENQDLYKQRSPINHTDRLSCPLILFQGLEDQIVPPSQAEMMFDAVLAQGLPTAYIPFEGEQHGFRRAENIKRVLEAELYFYSRVFGFELADSVEPVNIENLPD